MSLKASYDELRREIGRFLGFSRNPSEWEDVQSQDVEDILKAGQRHFYWPPAIEGVGSHVWSFLCPTVDMEFNADVREYELPSDFVRLRSDFTFGHNSNQHRIERLPETDIRSLWARSAVNGTPKYCAVRSSANQFVDGYELIVHPTPDKNYVAEYRYERSPPEITEDSPYHLGPAAHSELLVSACLMVADKMLNSEAVSPEGGLHAQRFFRQLAASISIDTQATG